LLIGGDCFLRRCSDCERKRVDEQIAKLSDSWMCFFFEDVWCPHSKIPKDARVRSVCQGCSHFAEFERLMEQEEAEEADLVENPEKYGFGGS
jgi:hypothetical protein